MSAFELSEVTGEPVILVKVFTPGFSRMAEEIKKIVVLGNTLNLCSFY